MYPCSAALLIKAPISEPLTAQSDAASDIRAYDSYERSNVCDVLQCAFCSTAIAFGDRIESILVMYQLAVPQGCLLPRINLIHTLPEYEALEYSAFVRQKLTEDSSS